MIHVRQLMNSVKMNPAYQSLGGYGSKLTANLDIHAASTQGRGTQLEDIHLYAGV